MSHSARAFSTRDRNLLGSLLRREPERAAYLLGDLDEPLFSHCRWFAATRSGQVGGVVAIFEALSKPVVLSYGAPDCISTIFSEFEDAMPDDCYCKIPIEHREAFGSVYQIVESDLLWVMALRRADVTPPASGEGIHRLHAADCDALEALYAQCPGIYFEASQLDTGVFLGRKVDGRLVSVAGTHVASPGQHIAVLGAVATAPGARGQGYAQNCTGRLIAELRALGCHRIALQVSADNGPAIACYRRLGFWYCGTVLQTVCRRRCV